jgi:glycosyltransferase involved in cell wall biosynthesis
MANRNLPCGGVPSDTGSTSPEHAPGLVSVIIPCYNDDRYIAEAVQSVLDQTYSNKEVIVVDDGSTDSSLEVIKSFGTAVRWQAGRHSGAGAARNAGLRLARGEYAKFLDSDDLLVKDALRRQVAQMASLLPARRAVVVGDLGIMNERGTRGRVYRYPPQLATEDPLAYLVGNNLQTACPLHRTGLLREVGGFNESLPHGQEGDIHLRLFLRGVRFHRFRGVVCFFRQHRSPSRISHRPWHYPDPHYRLQETRDRMHLIETAGYVLSEGVRVAYARYLTESGRGLIRSGIADVGEEYLAVAEALSQGAGPPVHKAYQVLRCLVGSYWAERLCLWRGPRLRRALRWPRMLVAGRRLRRDGPHADRSCARRGVDDVR